MDRIQLIENAIVQDKLKIDSIMQPENGEIAMQHRAIPHMTDMLRQLELYLRESKAEVDTASMMYRYLADCFTYVPYLPNAVLCYEKSLDCAIRSGDATLIGEIPELVYNIAKYRNIIARDRYYEDNPNEKLTDEKKGTLYDNCNNIDTDGKLSKKELRSIIEAAAETAGKSLLASASEHEERYLNALYDMNEELFNSLDGTPNDNNFRHAYWAAKKMYLLKLGINWDSPVKLNPNMK